MPGREGWIQKLGTGITSPCVEKGSGAWPRGAYPLAPATIPIRHGMCPGAWPRGAYQLAPVPISISPGVERYSQGRIQVNSSKVSAMSKLTGHSTNSHHRAPRLLERDPPGKGKPTQTQDRRGFWLGFRFDIWLVYWFGFWLGFWFCFRLGFRLGFWLGFYSI